ncbi:hypothetical protein [Corallococcus exiguus]|uniref:hypothetical protein n=1 Tax=Corallococcus exiguus TaxID=83462 RepID=UPI003DA46313
MDEACRPVGTRPVHVYWRMLERGPSEVEELLGSSNPCMGWRTRSRSKPPRRAGASG